MVRVLALILLWMWSLIVLAQKTKTVGVSYTYYATESQSIEESKRIALERAMLQAIADEYGTIVSQSNLTNISNENGHSKIDFKSIGASDLRGEWIETIGEPEYNISFSDNIVVVNCSVKGKIRQKTHAGVDFDVRLLRNTPSLNYESSEFHNGDNLYLYFQTPTPGFLTVYFIDENNTAYCILPYKNQKSGIYSVTADSPYIFFCKKTGGLEEMSDIDEYVMTCNGHPIINQVYVIFSPNKFHKANDNLNSQSLLRLLTYNNFMKWLSSNRNIDSEMNVRNFKLTIKE